MILNKLYRLKRKKGAVLFVVIAMMTLLVIMATAAYYTARSSHKTVINNYDFSQLYLSAVSVSDMMVGAITNEAVDGSSANNFKAIKEEVVKDTFTKITAKTNNIVGKTSLSDILDAARNSPEVSGILDAVQVVVERDKKGVSLSSFTGDTKDKDRYLDFYLITTTAYYRDNTVTITDKIAREYGKYADPDLFDTFFTCTGQSGPGLDDGTARLALIDTFEISDDAFFENDYTIFEGSSTAVNFVGGVRSSGDVWLNKVTASIGAPDELPEYDGDGNSNWGLKYKEDGEVDKSNQRVSGTRNDWFIGGSLVIGGNTDTLNLNGNNLVINGDLIIARGGINLSANKIFVKGNIIDLSGSASGQINADIYVQGTVVSNVNDINNLKTKTEGTSDPMGLLSDMNSEYSNIKTSLTGGGANLSGYNATGRSDHATSLAMGKDKGHKLYINGIYKKDDGTEVSLDIPTEFDSKSEGTSWVTDITWVPVEMREVEDDPSNPGYKTYNQYVNYSKNFDQALSGETKQNDYYFYTADATTMGNVLRIDFKNAVPTDSEGNKVYGTAVNFDVFNGTNKVGTAKVTVESSGKTKVELPYVSGGYVLDLNFEGSNSWEHNSIEYTIDTTDPAVEAKTGVTDKERNEVVLPIVLKANCNDGSGYPTDERGHNAFTWNVNGNVPHNISETTNRTVVKVTGKGDVFFEMGNYNKGSYNDVVGGVPNPDSPGDYKSYTSGSGLYTAAYVATCYSMVGTKAQLDEITGGDYTKQMTSVADYDKLFSTKPDTQAKFDNQIMLISNRANQPGDGKYYPGVRTDLADAKCNFLGYFYAPFSTYFSWCNSNTTPIFGGVIVRDYALKQSSYVYAEPDPQLIKNLESAMEKSGDADEDEIWHQRKSTYGLGSNFLG